MATHDYRIVNFQTTHHSCSRTTFTVQLTYICSKGCSRKDVGFVYKNAVLFIIQSTFYLTAVTFREISSTLAPMKLTADHRDACDNRSVVAAARGRESSRPSTLPPISRGLGVALEILWLIYCGVWG